MCIVNVCAYDYRTTNGEKKRLIHALNKTETGTKQRFHAMIDKRATTVNYEWRSQQCTKTSFPFD